MDGDFGERDKLEAVNIGCLIVPLTKLDVVFCATGNTIPESKTDVAILNDIYITDYGSPTAILIPVGQENLCLYSVLLCELLREHVGT